MSWWLELWGSGPTTVGYLAAAGTVPYLGLKAAWLSGSTVGLTDASLAVDPTLRIANALTAAMDLMVVGLALFSWGRTRQSSRCPTPSSAPGRRCRT